MRGPQPRLTAGDVAGVVALLVFCCALGAVIGLYLQGGIA